MRLCGGGLLWRWVRRGSGSRWPGAVICCRRGSRVIAIRVRGVRCRGRSSSLRVVVGVV